MNPRLAIGENVMLRHCLLVAPFAFGPVAAAQATSFPAPIEPAAQGKLQCHRPDHAKKTCQSLSGYRALGDGSLENTASVGLPASPVIVMKISSRLTTRDGQLCGYARKADFENARFFVNGAEVSEGATAANREWVTSLYQDLIDHEICSTYVPSGKDLVTRSTVDGKPAPHMSHRMAWVSPSDGYQITN